MREIYMLTVLSLKTARDKCPLPTNDCNKTNFKVGDIVLLKESNPQLQPLTLNTNLATEFASNSLTKLLTYRITQEKVGTHPFNIYNYYIPLTKY